ncbi:ETEC_3214 domain-containing protein [Streptomyces adonidis]|uniref:ETEC_3214 domain-containing protein n=1 Tax=Streptomyces adonidis TaxID=3231367 RepID=UPI0034DAFE3A
MNPDPEPWYSTTLNVWTLAGVLVASWTLVKTITEGCRRTIGRRRYLTTRLRKIVPGVRHDYVEGLLGEPKWQSTMGCTPLTDPELDNANSEDTKVEITVRTWPLSRLGYLITWCEDDAVVMYGITTTSWWFRLPVLIDQKRIRLGKTPLAALGAPEEHRAWLGNRRYGYLERHYFGNPGGYRWWYVGVNDIGYNAVPPSGNLFDEEDDSHTRLRPDSWDSYRASAPINTVVVSGVALYEEVLDGSFFGTSLGVDQDLVRLAEPEYDLLDSRIRRAHQRLREWHWRLRHRRWEKKQPALQGR